jgi:DNA-binding MarR family transcriptional regulator
MAALDPLIHAPARLRVVTTLSAVSEAEFATLRTALDVSDSVLSKHISALADAGYVRSRKGVREGRRTTWIGLTSAGRKALREHVAALRQLIDMVEPSQTNTSRDASAKRE